MYQKYTDLVYKDCRVRVLGILILSYVCCLICPRMDGNPQVILNTNHPFFFILK